MTPATGSTPGFVRIDKTLQTVTASTRVLFLALNSRRMG